MGFSLVALFEQDRLEEQSQTFGHRLPLTQLGYGHTCFWRKYLSSKRQFLELNLFLAYFVD